MIQKSLIFFFLFSNILVANSILDSYRENGIKDIERKLDKELTKKSYWEKIINKADTTFGYTEKYHSILLCDKEKSLLTLYQKDSNGTFSKKNRYSAFTGKNKGNKEHEGDLRTPVGIYTLTNKLSKIDSFYGPMAFVSSYPNLFDRYLNKNGHGIWIHGLPIDQKRDNFTKGCIAIENKGLECLDKEINLNNTLLLIYENKTLSQPDKEILTQLAMWLYKWRYAWKYNNLEQYLSYYAKDFKRFDGKNFSQFKQYKTIVFARKEKKMILFKDISIVPYPNHKNIYQITFYEKYKGNYYQFNGPKELLVRVKGDSIKIFSER